MVFGHQWSIVSLDCVGKFLVSWLDLQGNFLVRFLGNHFWNLSCGCCWWATSSKRLIDHWSCPSLPEEVHPDLGSGLSSSSWPVGLRVIQRGNSVAPSSGSL